MEEPSLLRAHGKRPSDQITEGNGSEGEEDDEEDGPQLKKFKVDKYVCRTVFRREGTICCPSKLSYIALLNVEAGAILAKVGAN